MPQASSSGAATGGGPEALSPQPAKSLRFPPFAGGLWGLLPLVLPLAFFWRAALGLELFYDGDVFRHFYSQKVAYLEALKRGTLPLWTPELAAGFPLYAEGEAGALYPLNLLLYSLLPLRFAFNYSFLLHYSLAGGGMYLFLGRLKLRSSACLLGAMVFAFSGFNIGHLSHLNILSGAAWLPLLLALVDMAQERLSRGLPSAMVVLAALGLLWGFELLVAHPQVSLLAFAGLLAYLLFGAWTRRRGASPWRLVGGPLLALVLGLGLAAVQLLPTLELARLSQRGGGLDPASFTSFSLHPAYLVSLVHPFILGNPYPRVSVELAGYVGILPLMLAMAALVFRRNARTAFFAAVGAVALLLALGRWNPLYAQLVWLPVVNFFRIPARFLYLFDLAAGVLAAQGLDALEERRPSPPGLAGKALGILIPVACLVGMTLVGGFLSLEDILALWRYLPLALLAAGLALLLGFLRRYLTGWALVLPVLGMVLFDLYAYAAVYARTYNATLPTGEFFARPRWSACAIEGDERCRIYTDEKMLPLFAMRRETLFPNTGLIYGVESANAYLPLLPRNYIRYMEGLSPERLNLLNIRYYPIPQVLPVDEAAEEHDLANPFSPNLAGQRFELPPTEASALELESFLSHAAHLKDGELVAEIVLRLEGGTEVTLPVRAGLETAEWAYLRDDVQRQIQHRAPPVVRSWPARSGYPPREHLGQTYLAHYDLAGLASGAARVVGVETVAHHPSAFMRFERMTLISPAGERKSLAHLAGWSEHLLIYRSEDAAIYRNEDALPRAYVAHRARVIPEDDEALAYLDGPGFSRSGEVVLDRGEPLEGEALKAAEVRILEYSPTRISIHARLDSEGYLVLADAYYPGWEARVDGKGVEVVRANLLFRAVRLPPGEHRVEFLFRPRALHLGAAVSLVSLVLLAACSMGRHLLCLDGRGERWYNVP